MKTVIRFFAIFLLFLVAACVPSQQKNGEIFTPIATQKVKETALPAVKTGLTEQLLRNMSFLSPSFGTTVQLTNGQYSEGETTVSLLPQMAIGDLNGDQIDDAVVLLAESGGGSGSFVSLVVIASQDGQFHQVGSAMIDDRPVIETLKIEDGTFLLNAVVHGINDPMVSPTLKISLTYKLLENNLAMMSRSSTAQGGTEHSIRIDAPADGSEISHTFEVKGSMPVAPFENSLRIRVVDTAGMELFSDGFMVTSADVGGPATFDNEIKLPAYSSGTWVKVELAELSMMDGAVVTMDSVLVKIK